MPTTLAAFPADDPIWNTGGLNRATPLDAKQALGWTSTENPPSSSFNWFMFYVGEYVQHYKAAIAQVNDAKVDRAGDDQLAGHFLPNFDGGWNLGSATFRWLEVFTLAMTVGTIRRGSSTTDIGTSALRLRKLWFESGDFSSTMSALSVSAETSNINSMQANTSILPGTAGVVPVGSLALPWLEVVTRDIKAKTAMCYRDNTLASTALEAGSLNQQKNIVASGRISSTGVVSTNHFNISGATNSLGSAVVTFDQAIDDDATVVCTSTAVGSREVVGSVAVGGATCTFTQWSAGAPLSQTFNFIIVGRARGGITDSIL